MEDKTKRKIKGSALAVGGAGIAFGAPAVSRAENKVSAFRVSRIDRKIADVKASFPKKPDPADRRMGSKTMGENPREKFARQDKIKDLHGQLHDLNRKRKSAARPRVYRNQTKVWAAGLGVGLPTSYAGARETVKKADKRDVNAAYAGGIGGFAGYQGGSLALKPLDRRAERKIKNDPDLLDRQKAYQRSSHRPKNATAGDPRWRPYFRNYPKDLPGGRLKRTLAVTHTGRSGTALTGAVTVGSAAASVGLARKHNKKNATTKIGKSMTESAFGVDHGEIAKRDYGSNGPPTAGRLGAAGAFSGWHGAFAGKPGKKLRSFGNEAGGAMLGSMAGQVAGAAATRGRSTKAAIGTGLVGGAIGGMEGAKRNQRKGYLKPQS